LFVRLTDLHIEGLVHITSLGRDFYHFDDVRMCLTGENTGNTYHVGDVLTVQVASVNLDEKKIDLVLHGENAVVKKAKPLRKGNAKKNGSTKNNAKGSFKKSHKDKSDKSTKSRSGTKVKKSSKVKSKAKKRTERSSRPGKNARNKTKKQKK